MNPVCIINPKTNRAVRTDTQTGKKLLKLATELDKKYESEKYLGKFYELDAEYQEQQKYKTNKTKKRAPLISNETYKNRNIISTETIVRRLRKLRNN